MNCLYNHLELSEQNLPILTLWNHFLSSIRIRLPTICEYMYVSACVFEHHLCWVIGLWRVWTLTVVAVKAHNLCGDTYRLTKTWCQNEKRHFLCYNTGPPTQLQTDRKKKVCSCSDIFNKTAIQASNSWTCQITKEKHHKNQNSFSPLIFQLPLTLYFLSSVSGPAS